MIFIGDQQMMENLRRHEHHHKSEIRNAIGGADLPPVPAALPPSADEPVGG